jgi:hypothetical protein
MRQLPALAASVIAVALIAVPSLALADGPATAAKPAGGGDAVAASIAGDDADAPKPATPPPAKSSTDPTELPGQTYISIGLRYRHSVLPNAMLGLFVAGGPDVVSIPGFGIEAAVRRDNSEQIYSLTYRDWGMSPFGFHGKSDPNTATEVVNSSLKMIMLQSDILWATPFTKEFSFEYGLTAGIGAVFGDLGREWAQPGQSGAADVTHYVSCFQNGGLAPGADPLYCTGRTNNHKAGYQEPSWFNGGSKPNIYAALGPQISFRYKPIKQVILRADLGFDFFSGFFFGLGADYGL